MHKVNLPLYDGVLTEPEIPKIYVNALIIKLKDRHHYLHYI